MKIVRLTAENVKKLRAVEITPTGALVEITGRNGAGKSSVLDSLWWALAGAKHIQAVPIRKGATKARIRLDLGELVVERRFTEGDRVGALTVANAEGARYGSPQSLLDALLGALAFDPLAFVGQTPRDQYETLRGIVPLDVDPEQLDGLNRRDFDARRELNRDARAKRAQAEGIAVPHDLLAERADVAALKDRLAAAARENAELEQRRARREQAGRDIVRNREIAAHERQRATDLRAEADRLDRIAADVDRQADELEAKLRAAEPLPDPVDADALRRELDAAEETNRRLEQRDRKAALVREAEGLEKQSLALTEAMEARERAKVEAIARAPMPVPGLGFGDGIVTFGGVPFDQASTAEQLRVSVAIAMQANPRLRVIRIREGSLLDDENLALIAQMAREHDYQVWVETVSSAGRPAVVIEDGQVVEVRAGAETDAQA